ncbi:MAG: outer membrane lipoprotein-sorting protein [Bacteroidales bacterium]|nr:outer membrane lipoprotein-sorting protein [Bacteroidales bacterium]
MKHLTIILGVLLTLGVSAQTADEILDLVDKNMSSDNRIIESTMIIHGKRVSRTITLKSWSVGNEQAFTEYLSPAREQGTKMLKIENQLWIYSPSTDRTIQIAGHMLRQSVMGSDLSYEDMMEDRELKEVYNAEVIDEETVDERNTWVLELTAKVADVAYYSRKTWIDQERFVPLREELYAKSGQLLKRTDLKDVKQIQGRWFPMKMVFKDMLKDGDGTEYLITSIQFNQQIPEYIFTKAALKQ